MISEVQDASILQWAQNKLSKDLKLDVHFSPEASAMISVHDDKKILGVVVLYNHNPPANIEMAIVTDSPKWCTKALIKRVFDYCFNELEVKRVFAQVKSNNHKALDMDKRLGFEEIAVIPDYYVTKHGKVCDNHILSMTKEQCKWI